MPPLLQSQVPGFPCRRGKVRDVYDLGDRLVLIATDRLSAFDWVLPSGIPDKGRILTALTRFWFDFLKVPNHYLSDDLAAMVADFASRSDTLAGRSMLVKKAEVVPIGAWSAATWRDPVGRSTRLAAPCAAFVSRQACARRAAAEPIFTPATKEEHGHDINISFARMAEIVGPAVAEELQRRSIDVYRRAAEHARSRGIIIADTKFEWGRLPDGSLILVDEVLTPDSSRFWPLDSYQVGANPPSFDKQFVRDWLETTSWDKNSPPPTLPEEVALKTRAKYLEAYERLTGQTLG